MRRHSYIRTLILSSLGGLAVLAVAALVVHAASADRLRRAAKTQSPEDAQLKQLPAPAQKIGRPSKAELLNRCQQVPKCRAKLAGANKGGKPTKALPAARSASPEDEALKKLPQPAKPTTPRRFQKGVQAPWPLDKLMAWVNPFQPSVAEAQTAVSVFLTPQNRWISSPYSVLSLYGVNYWGSYHLSGSYSTTSAAAENKPYVYFRFNAPATGWYIFNFRASNATLNLRHNYSGPIVETWNAGNVPCTGNQCDYVTAEYLEQGSHYFYFYSKIHNYYFYSVSLESYP